MGKLKKLARCAAVLFSLTLATGCVYYQAKNYNTGDWKPPEVRKSDRISFDAAAQEERINADTPHAPMMSSSKSIVIQTMPTAGSGLNYYRMPQAPYSGVVDEPNPSWVLIEEDTQPTQRNTEPNPFKTKSHETQEEQNRRLIISSSKSAPIWKPDPIKPEQSQQK